MSSSTGKQTWRKPRFLLAIIFVISLSGMVLAATYVERRIGSTGYIFTPNPSIQVYSDSGCTNILTQIGWGTLEAGDGPTRIIYIKNIGNTQLLVNITTANWIPANAPTYISLSSNVNDFTLAPNAVQTSILTLTVSSSIQGITDFGFDIIVGGS